MQSHTDLLLSIVQILGIIFGAIWAWFGFRIELPHKPRIELELDAVFLGPQMGRYIGSISIRVHNKGTVNHTIEQLEIDIRGLKHNDPIQTLSEKEQRVNFPEKTAQSRNIIPSKYKHYFVRAGVQQTILYHTSIPEDIRFVRAWAAFRYSGADGKHTVERIFNITP